MKEFFETIMGVGISEVDTAFIVSQLIGFITLIIVVAAAQFKRMEWIAAAGFTTNALTVLSYILLGGISGSYTCIVGMILTVCAFIYAKKNLKFPKWLAICFAIICIALCIYSYKSPADILPGIGSVMYSLGIVQSKASAYRKCMLINCLAWLAYDIYVSAFAMLFTHGIGIVSVIIGILRFDIKKKKA